MALGKSAGRVSIRVVPDATKFRNDLKLVLQRVERTMTANLAVTADTRPFDISMRKLLKDVSGKEAKLDVDAVTKGASAHIAAVARRRSVPLDLKVNAKKALTEIGGVVATLTGLKAGSGLLNDLSSSITGLLNNLPRIALTSTAILGLGAAGLNAVRGLGSAAVSLAQLVPLTALLPSGLAAGAIGITTLVLAFKQVPASVTAAASSYKALQGVVSRNFWAEAAKPIRQFLTGILPDLKTGFADVAKSAGSSLGSLASDLNSTLGHGALSFVFSQTSAAITAASPGLLAFSEAFTSLLGTGAVYLPIFGGWISKIGQQFAGWLAGVQISGQLDGAIQTAIITLGQLGSIVVSVGRILAGVFNAGSGGGIAALAAGLQQVAVIVNSPTFQTALGTIFQGASLGAAGLAAALGPIGGMLATLAPVISGVLASSGAVLGSLLSQLATALAQPAFQTGLVGFFTGIQTGLQAIGPALPALASAFGSLGAFAGQLAAQLGPVLGAVFTALAPVVTQLFAAVQPLLPVLGAALITAIQTLAPLLANIATTVLPPLVSAFSTLITAIGPLLTAVMPILQALLPPIAAIFAELSPIISAVFQAIDPLIQALGPILTPILTALTPLLQGMAPVWQILGDVIGIFASVVGAVIQTLVDLLTGNFSDIGKVWSDVWDGIQDKFQDIWSAIQSFGKGAFNGLMDLLGGLVNGVIDRINSLTDGLNDVLAGIKVISGGSIDLHIGKIPHVSLPHLAIGADIIAGGGGTLALLGEGKRNERVIDQGLGNRQLQLSNALAERALAAGGGGHDGPLIGQIVAPPGQDARVFGKLVGRELDDLMNGR